MNYMFVKSTRFKQVCQLLLSLIVPTLAAWEIGCEGKQRCQPRLLILETLYFSFAPLPPLSTAQLPTTLPPPRTCPQIDPAA